MASISLFPLSAKTDAWPMQVRKSKRAIIRLIKGTPGDGVMDRKYIFAGMPPFLKSVTMKPSFSIHFSTLWTVS